jgi:hypothetical protein
MNASKKICTVTCPYCSAFAELVSGDVIYPHRRDLAHKKYWLCNPCDAYVGVHEGSPKFAPLGRLANRELRDWKQRAHAVFDPLWKRGTYKRTEAYAVLQQKMGLTKEQAHIGKMDVDQCKRVVELFGTPK